MEKYIEKADVLIEALPYIKNFYGKKVVIKFGGSVMTQEDKIRSVLEDIVFMRYVGMKPIIIHGGGPAISDVMREKGLHPQFIDGLRVTNRETMDIVEDVLVHNINKYIVDIINEMQGYAEGLSGRDGGLIKVRKHMPYKKGKDESLERIDLGYVGEVTEINPIPVQDIKNKGNIPVIAPIGVDENGESYNINGDITAGEIAAALDAEKLVFLTDVIGIMKDPTDEESLISTLTSKEVEELIENGTLHGGMIPKVNSCIKALNFGAHKAHIIDGRISHSLLLEMFTVKGIGTEIVE